MLENVKLGEGEVLIVGVYTYEKNGKSGTTISFLQEFKSWQIQRGQRTDGVQAETEFTHICCFLSGGVSAELGRMISLEEDVVEKMKERDFFQVGEAILKSDGEKTRFMKVGEIRDIDAYKRQILTKLLRSDG